MQLTCPECKNVVDLSGDSEIEVGYVVECNSCGITLEINEINGDKVEAEVVEEGK